MEGGEMLTVLSASCAIYVLKALGVTRGSQHHPYVGGQSLEEKFAEESSVRGGRVVSEQLLHLAE